MTEQESITAKIRVIGVFYRPDKPLLFSVEVEGHPEITYADVPIKDAEFRMMAADAGKPLKQFCLEWNDKQIELDRLRDDELEKRGLLFRATSNEVNSAFMDSFRKQADEFYKANGIDMEPD